MNTDGVQQAAVNVAGGSPLPNIPNVDNNAPSVVDGQVNGSQTPEVDTLEENTAMDKTQWLTIFLLGLTVVSLVMNIVSSRKQILMLDRDDKTMKKDIDEVKSNVKKLMGDKYESS